MHTIQTSNEEQWLGLLILIFFVWGFLLWLLALFVIPLFSLLSTSFFQNIGFIRVCLCECVSVFFYYSTLQSKQDVIDSDQLLYRSPQTLTTKVDRKIELISVVSFFFFFFTLMFSSKEISGCWKWIISICLMTFGVVHFFMSVPLCVFSAFF